MPALIVLTNCRDNFEAETIANCLVENNLAACVNIIPSIKSIYRWQGKVCNEQEVLLVIKAQSNLQNQLEAKILELHSYDTPEFIVLKPEYVEARYLKWLLE